MSNLTSLAEMLPGKKGKVIKIQGGYGISRKLENLGIREGIEITKLSSQLGTGPVVMQVGNTQIAIGFGMAKKIILEEIE